MCKKSESEKMEKVTGKVGNKRLNSMLRNYVQDGTLNVADSQALVMLLFASGADIPKDIEFMISALDSGFTDIVKLCISNGANINEDLVYSAVEQDELEIANLILDKDPSLAIKCFDALYKAIESGYVDFVKKLITAGIDVNADNGKALITAIVASEEEIFDILIDSGADIKVNNNEPIRTATKNVNNVYFVKKLIELGVDATAMNNEAFLNLIKLGSAAGADILRELIEANVDVTANDCFALRATARDRNICFLDILLRTGKFSSSIISECFLRAVRCGYGDVIELLLDYHPSKESIKKGIQIIKEDFSSTYAKEMIPKLKKALKRL